jgi:hypothetical protein
MNDLLWLVNHPLWGNVAGILTSRNPDTLEGLESRFSVKIHRIPAELPHLTELELNKLRWTWIDSGRTSAFKLLWWLPTSQEVLRSSEPRLSLYSTRMNLGALQGVKPHFLHTFCQGEHRGIYRRSKVVLWPKIGHVRPTYQAGRPWNLAGRPRLVAPPPFPHWILLLPTYFDTWWKRFL